MKNILLFILFFAIFACGNEKASTSNQTDVSTEKSTPSATTSNQITTPEKVDIDGAATKKSAAEIQQELIDKAKSGEETKEAVKETVSNVANSVKEKGSNAVENVKKEASKVVDNNAQVLADKKEKALLEKKQAEEAAQKLAKEQAMKKAEMEKKLADKKTAVEKPDFVDEKQPPPPPPAFTHAPFDALLKKHVSSSGKVNYKGFKSDESKLNAYLNQLEGTPIDKGWSKNKKMAYWINAYNAYTIKLILNNYPISSIQKLEGGKPWDKKWIKLDGRTLSLNNIENDILRPTYKDARIHFAVNCAAKSCPPLLNQAWTASNLNANFEKQAKAFINNSKFNNISGSKVEVSKIFDWYGEDFGDLRSYLNKYSNDKINAGTSIQYMDYDWSLNE